MKSRVDTFLPDMLAKLTPDDQKAYSRYMIITKTPECIESLLEYLEEEAKLMSRIPLEPQSQWNPCHQCK